MDIPKEIEEALFGQLLAQTLKWYDAPSLKELTKGQKNTYYRDVGLLRILINDVRKKNNIPEWFNAKPQPPTNQKPSEYEPPF